MNNQPDAPKTSLKEAMFPVVSAPKLIVSFLAGDQMQSDEDNKVCVEEPGPASEEKDVEVYNHCLRSSILHSFPSNAACMLCCATFGNGFELQAHLALQRHDPREELLHAANFQNPHFDCVVCHAKQINKFHHCLLPVVEGLEEFVVQNTREGTPITCIVCEGRKMKSVHHLIIHIVTFHGFRSKPQGDKHLSCPICHAPFKTRNSFVIEAHALDVHLPELVLKKQKQMHPENQAHSYTTRHFACFFENAKYTPIAREEVLRNCSTNFYDMSGLIGHLCYAHYPVPKDFLPTKARPITCNACLFRFKNRTLLRDHVYSSHSHVMKFRATTLSFEISFEDHSDPAAVCHFCWTWVSSVARLQAHVLVYHMASWRTCGFCGRDFCGAGENVSPVILFLTMERHVDHHARQLEKHFEEMVRICQLRQPPHKAPQPPHPDEFYFRNMRIVSHRADKADNTETILAHFGRHARSESFDMDDIL